MSIIDWGALDRNGMPAFMAALKALEARVEAQDHETARDMRNLYAAVGYQDERRKDDRAIRNELEQRLAVVEEQTTNMAAALRTAQVEFETLQRAVAELTHDMQTDLLILQDRMEAQQCAVCGQADATTGPDKKLCVDCLEDVRAGIEATGLAGMRVRRPRAGHRDWGKSTGGYCPECRIVMLWGARRWRTCEDCGAELEPVATVRHDAAPMAWPGMISRAAIYAVTNGDNGNGGGDE